MKDREHIRLELLKLAQLREVTKDECLARAKYYEQYVCEEMETTVSKKRGNPNFQRASEDNRKDDK